MMPVIARGRARGGYSIIEVLASLAIFLFGIVAIINFLPNALRSHDEAALMSVAAMLAQEKVSEIRRDNPTDVSGTLLTDLIRARTTPTEPVAFPRHPQLAYAFNGRSILDPTDDAGDPTDDFDVPRVVIMRYFPDRPPVGANVADWDILVEYRFDE